MSPAGIGSASDGGSIAPDGSPVGLYRQFPPGNEPNIIHESILAGCAVLELGCGAGRITHELLKLGHNVVAVDESLEMLTNVTGARCVNCRIEALSLGEKFDAVILGSYLVNTLVPGQCEAFLETCQRHVCGSGVVLVQRTPPQWAHSLEVGKVSHLEDFTSVVEQVSLKSGVLLVKQSWRKGDITWTHTWSDLILTDEQLIEVAAVVGLTFERWVDTGREWALLTPRPE